MRAMMVLTPANAVNRAARAGELAHGRPWQPAHLAAPKLADVDVLVCVYLSALERPNLVAVLHDPVRDAEGWRGDGNTTAMRDIQLDWRHLTFADDGPPPTSDVRVTLRKPRLLSESDLERLRIRATGATPAPRLTLIGTRRPSSVDELDAIERKQVEAAGRGYDGQRLSAAARLERVDPREPDRGSFFGSLTVRRFEDARERPGAKTRGFNVLTYRGDSGSVFRAGSTEQVAHIIQGGLQCEDRKLFALLEATLSSSEPPRRATKEAPPQTRARRKKPAAATRPASGTAPARAGTRSAGPASADDPPTLEVPAARTAPGLARVRAGLAIDDGYDRAFGLGYPFLLVGTPDLRAPDELARAVGTLAFDGPLIEMGVAIRALRVLLGQGFTLGKGGVRLARAGARAAQQADPVSTDEAAAGLVRLMAKRSASHLALVPLLLEVVLGADTAARLLTDAIERISDARLRRNDGELSALVTRLGFVLLRAGTTTNRQVRRRLRGWLDERQRLLPGGRLAEITAQEPQRSPLRAADVMLHGAVGIARSAARPGGRLDPAWLFFCDDPALVADAVRRSPNGSLVAPLDARHAFTGGDAALATLMKRVAKVPHRDAHRFVASFGPIRHPLVLAWLTRLARRVPEAARMLARHRSR